MTFHNSPDGYRGVEPSEDNILGASQYRINSMQHEGLFYRKDLNFDTVALTERLLVVDSSSTIQHYQYWAETGWKEEHGTYSAVNRFQTKLHEEYSEFKNSVYDHLNSPLERDMTIANICLEAGDVLWCATALASCADADINTGFHNRLFRYVMGVRYFDNGEPFEPEWRDIAAQLAIKYEQLTIDDLDKLIAAGFEPLPSPARNVYDRPDESVEGHLNTLLYKYNALRLALDIQYGYGDKDGSNTSYETMGMFHEHSARIGELVCELYLEVAYIAKSAARLNVADIVSRNVAKLTDRMTKGVVDKADGRSSKEKSN